MWFFAIVYAVEGIGQARSGIMWQPLSHWLKESFSLDAGDDQRLGRDLRSALG